MVTLSCDICSNSAGFEFRRSIHCQNEMSRTWSELPVHLCTWPRSSSTSECQVASPPGTGACVANDNMRSLTAAQRPLSRRDGRGSPGRFGCTSRRSMSLSGPPSCRAADPNTHAYVGLTFQAASASLIRFHSASRRSAIASAAGAARCSRLSSWTRFRPIRVEVTIPCSTSRESAFLTPISEPRGTRAATSPTVSGRPVAANTARMGPSRVGVMDRVGSVRSTI